MKVKATDAYEKLTVADRELNKIPKKGEIFEISEARFKILNGNNQYNAVFVELAVEENDKEMNTEEVDKILNTKNHKGKSKNR